MCKLNKKIVWYEKKGNGIPNGWDIKSERYKSFAEQMKIFWGTKKTERKYDINV